jgi:F-type H+-transporting ATPase subunit b
MESSTPAWVQQIPIVVTHIIGFVIAVLVLKRFAWGPILKLLDERREKIQGEFDRIETSKREVAELREQYGAQLRDIEAQRRAKIQEGVTEGRRVGSEIQEQARQDAHGTMIRGREETARERDRAQVMLRNDMVEMVIKATEQLLKERLDADQHRRLVNEYLSELETTGRGGDGR